MYFNDDIRDRLGFDLVAQSYHAARPSYPQVIYQKLLEAMQLKIIPCVLEIGSGSGQMTFQLAPFTTDLDALEPGMNFFKLLASEIKASQIKDSHIHIFHTEFEEYQTDKTYDLIASGCALHWIPKEFAYEKIGRLLKPGGWLMASWNQVEFPQEVDQIVTDVLGGAVAGLGIPSCTQNERDLFEKGYQDFTLHRGFVNTFHDIAIEMRYLDRQGIFDLIWSYVSPVDLDQGFRDDLYKKLRTAVFQLEEKEYQLKKYFPYVFGQKPLE